MWQVCGCFKLQLLSEPRCAAGVGKAPFEYTWQCSAYTLQPTHLSSHSKIVGVGSLNSRAQTPPIEAHRLIVRDTSLHTTRICPPTW